MVDELVACPHCGNMDVTLMMKEGKNGFRNRYFVLCDYSEGGCGAASGYYHSRSEAIWSWNRRTDCGKGRWFNVKITPPPNKDYVYAYTKYKETWKMYRTLNRSSGKYYWADEYGKYCDDDMVTHWRPLFDDPDKDDDSDEEIELDIDEDIDEDDEDIDEDDEDDDDEIEIDDEEFDDDEAEEGEE